MLKLCKGLLSGSKKEMYLMYVDESGDTGMVNSPSRYFCLSGLVVHELKWKEFIEFLLSVRKGLTTKYGISFREEIHAAEFLRHAHRTGLEKHIRLQIIRDIVRSLATVSYINVTNIVIDKHGKSSNYDVFDAAWQLLFQRFENTLNHRNFPGAVNPKDYGMVFCDDTDGKKLQSIVRRMSVYNPVPTVGNAGYRQLPIKLIIEDPNMRNSENSLPIQAADMCAYMLQQHIAPNSYIKKKTGHGFFKDLLPILNTKASRTDVYGIVKI
jgi:hypothetical protein